MGTFACPTCGTQVPEGASRCPVCASVFGEENRCPHCHAIAPVRMSGSKMVCLACGKPRVGATLAGGGSALDTLIPKRSHRGKVLSHQAFSERSRGSRLRAGGAFGVVSGIVGASMALLLFPIGTVPLAIFAGAGVGTTLLGGLAIRSGMKRLSRADESQRLAEEIALFEMAEDEGGRLTARFVAERSPLSHDEADRLLTRIVGDGSRISVDVTPDGVVEYIFHEFQPTAARVRVTTEVDAEVEVVVEREAAQVRSPE